MNANGQGKNDGEVAFEVALRRTVIWKVWYMWSVACLGVHQTICGRWGK